MGGELPQHRVDQPRCPGHLVGLGLVYRLIDGGAVWHPVQKQDLIGTQAQDIQQHRLQFFHFLGAEFPQSKIQPRPILHHAIDQPSGQGRIGAGEAVLGNGGFQRAVRPGTALTAGDQHPQRGLPRSGAHWRPPPLRPSPPPLAKKISRYRSSCSRDISSAAT